MVTEMETNMKKQEEITDIELEQFMKQEKQAFFWVTAGGLLLLIGILIWKYCPGLQETLNLRCGIHDMFHIYCPGCGGTRAVYSLLKLHIVESFMEHPMVLFTAVILADYYIGAIITLIRKNGKRYYYLRTWFCYVALGIVIVNFIVRNVLLIRFHYDYMGDLINYWMNIR